MDSPDVIRRLHEHRDWVNNQLLIVAEQLEESQLHQEFQIGQGTIWKSLLHMYAAEYIWLEAIQGNDDPVAPGDLPDILPGNQQGENPIETFIELRVRWEKLNDRWKAWLNVIQPESLEYTIHKKSRLLGPGHAWATSMLDVIIHVCTHAHYTVAQINNMLRQLGHQPLPDPMMISLARQQHPDNTAFWTERAERPVDHW